MDSTSLHTVAAAMVAKPKGILAMDESTGTIAKRFSDIGVENTEENRRRYREMLVTASGLGQRISGAIMFEETLFQETEAGVPFVECLRKEGIIPGIKVDMGLEKQPNGEELTKGLDDLKERLARYKAAGARFAKWRAVIRIGEGLPTEKNIAESARRLAAYAKACQDAGIVPIVEPEVLMDGDHTLARCEEVTRDTLKAVFRELAAAKVDLKGMVLKPNMIVPGKDGPEASAEEIAQRTVAVLKECVPKEVPGIAFLSGGIGDDDVTVYLNEMNKAARDLPWSLTFSFGRGLQRGALESFGKGDLAGGQKALLDRAKESSMAAMGTYRG